MFALFSFRSCFSAHLKYQIFLLFENDESEAKGMNNYSREPMKMNQSCVIGS